MTYSGFQRFDESQAYSRMKRERREDNKRQAEFDKESEAQERKKILDKCELASQRIEEEIPEAPEELYQFLRDYNDLRDRQTRKY